MEGDGGDSEKRGVRGDFDRYVKIKKQDTTW